MEKVSFKTVGIVVGALLVLFLFVNAIPWATKAEVQEIREDLKIWYPVISERVIKIEKDVEFLKEGQKEIKQLVIGQRE